MILIHKETLSGTTAAGAFSVNTQNLRLGGLLSIISVRPATESTTYNVKIVDSDSFTLYERTSETGELSEEVLLPVRGVYTITVSSADKDELFNIRLTIRE